MFETIEQLEAKAKKLKEKAAFEKDIEDRRIKAKSEIRQAKYGGLIRGAKRVGGVSKVAGKGIWNLTKGAGRALSPLAHNLAENGRRMNEQTSRSKGKKSRIKPFWEM